jgi:hypothetical protein
MMRVLSLHLLNRAGASVLTTLVVAACFAFGSVQAADSAQVPTPEETRAIAEEGFIYGLPIVMNYAVMYAYAVDKDSGQF